MPRLATSVLRQAYSQSPYLALLLRATRDLDLARNELRWLKEYIARIRRLSIRTCKHDDTNSPVIPRLETLVRLRATGLPLQYVLGSQPFGDLEVLCRKGVLIPRPETETYTTRLANLLSRWMLRSLNLVRKPLRVLDLCAGSGCIGLGLLSSLIQNGIDTAYVHAIDINPRARNLALKTVRLNQRLGSLPQGLLESRQYVFRIADILSISRNSNRMDTLEGSFDIAISNPPYISNSSLSKDTSRSARRFEPRNALVPDGSSLDTIDAAAEKICETDSEQQDLTGDVFYGHIVRIAASRHARIVLVEVTDMEQALRVIDIVSNFETTAAEQNDPARWEIKQIWRDEIDIHAFHKSTAIEKKVYNNSGIDIIGTGQARAVVLARNWGVDVLQDKDRK